MHLRWFCGQVRSIALICMIYVETAPRCCSDDQAKKLCCCNWISHIITCYNPLSLFAFGIWFIILLIVDLIVFIIYLISCGYCCECKRLGCKEGCHCHPLLRHSPLGPWSCQTCYYVFNCQRDPDVMDWEECESLKGCACWKQIRSLSYEKEIDLRCDMRILCCCCKCLDCCEVTEESFHNPKNDLNLPYYAKKEIMRSQENEVNVEINEK